MESEKKLFVTQKAFIEKDGRVLILNKPKEGLDFPGGRIQKGEISLSNSLKREIAEEVGLTVKIGSPFVTWLKPFFDGHKLNCKKVLIAYHCKYLSGEVRLSAEHSSFRWVDKDNYREANDGTTYFAFLEGYFEK